MNLNRCERGLVQRLGISIATVVVAVLSIASVGVAGGPPVVNEKDHVID